MLRQTTIWVHSGHMAKIDALAKSRGLKAAQLVRLAIRDYLRRELAKEKSHA